MMRPQPFARLASGLLPLIVATTACGQAPSPSASPTPAAAATPAATASPAADAPQVVTYQFGLLRKGPKWKPSKGDELKELQAAHLANIVRLAETGALVAAGPVEAMGESDLRGIFVFKVASADEARTLADSD